MTSRAQRRIVLCLIVASFSLAGLSAAAEEKSPARTYADYSAFPVGTDVKVGADKLAWLNQVFDLMGGDDFTFIHRQDSGHWMGLYRQGRAMLVGIHDEDARFDFRGLVDRGDGRVTVIKGTAKKGQAKREAAAASAAEAAGYLRRALAKRSVFAEAPAAEKPAAAKKAAPPAKAEAGAKHGSAAKAEPATHGGAGPAAEKAEEEPGLTEKHASAEPAAAMDENLKRLMEGNARFVSGKSAHANQTKARREEVAKGQKPFAVVLTCSDSRLPPEILFDQGLGDIFVVRTAGEVVGDLELGSIEYAVEHLHAAHLMVLGHERCGAVQATVDAVTGKGGEVSPNIARIAAQIKPSVEAVQAAGGTGDLLDLSIRRNVQEVLKKAENSPVLEEAMREKKLSVSAAYYDLDTGTVSLLE